MIPEQLIEDVEIIGAERAFVTHERLCHFGNDFWNIDLRLGVHCKAPIHPPARWFFSLRQPHLSRLGAAHGEGAPSSLQIIILPKPQRLHSLSTCSSHFGNFNITRDDSIAGCRKALHR
jgi:hypothetical protein